jgi:hypothetical protein
MILNNYLENLHDKNVKENVLKLHKEIETSQTQHINDIEKYNERLSKVKALLKNNDEVLLQLFMSDIIEHKTIVQKLYDKEAVETKEIVI